jgi:hypothetical protein
MIKNYKRRLFRLKLVQLRYYVQESHKFSCAAHKRRSGKAFSYSTCACIAVNKTKAGKIYTFPLLLARTAELYAERASGMTSEKELKFTIKRHPEETYCRRSREKVFTRERERKLGSEIFSSYFFAFLPPLLLLLCMFFVCYFSFITLKLEMEEICDIIEIIFIVFSALREIWQKSF